MGIRILIFLQFYLISIPIFSEENALGEWRKFSKSKSAELVVEYLRCQALSEMNVKKCDTLLPETPPFFGQIGIFITIVNKGKIRGCFGAFQHKSTNLSNVLIEYIRGALRDDPRYSPLEIEELKTSYFILTIADSPVPIVDIDSIALGRYGIYLSNENGQGTVYVPGEIKSHSSLKRIIKSENIQDVSVFKAILIR